MKDADAGLQRIRMFGLVWLLLSPVVYFMAAISTVESETYYRAQLMAFSTVAGAGIVFGVAGVLKRAWAAYGLLTLSAVSAAYWFGSALLILIWPFVPRSTAKFGSVSLLLPLVIAPFGVPFVLMYRSLRRIVGQRDSTVESNEA